MSDIEKRLRASLKFDAINGDYSERAICASQMREAAAEIERLRTELSEPRAKAEEQTASVPEGWKLVPIKPTPAMSAAGFVVPEASHDPAGVYLAMLAAAPEAPKS